MGTELHGLVEQSLATLPDARARILRMHLYENFTPEQIATMSLFRFPNQTGLKAQGGNLFSESAASGSPQAASPGLDGTGIIRQGYQERSNVQVVDELVALILAQRNYEINARAIKVSDEMLQQVNQMAR